MIALDELVFPAPYCPLEGARNPAADRIEAYAMDWVDKHGLCETASERASLLDTRSADFCARFFPEADEERLLAITLWVYWGFAFDDVYCDNAATAVGAEEFAEVAGLVQRAWEVPTTLTSADPRLSRYLVAMQDLSARFHRLGSPTQLNQVNAAHCAWLFAVAWQVGNRSRGVLPTVDGYLMMRLGACGISVLCAMTGFANRIEVPAREWHAPAVKALTEMATTVVALDNDRHSLVKELRGGQDEQNIFTVLLGQGRTLPEAVEEATGLRDRMFCRFVELADRVAAQGSPELRQYVQGLRWGIRGNAEWGLVVPRYREGGEVEDLGITWADRPSARGSQAPPASIDWWWQDFA